MKEAFDNLKQFWSIKEDLIWMQREVCNYLELLIGIELAADSFIKIRGRLVLSFFLTSSSERVDKMLSASNSQHENSIPQFRIFMYF
jgi:hypothetical protein